MLMKKSLSPSIIFLSAISFSTPAYAYLDPGTGSIVLQLLLGGTAGAVMVGRLYWDKIKAIFGNRPQADDLTEEKDTENQ